jgi:hypothetical protein
MRNRLIFLKKEAAEALQHELFAERTRLLDSVEESTRLLFDNRTPQGDTFRKILMTALSKFFHEVLRIVSRSVHETVPDLPTPSAFTSEAQRSALRKLVEGLPSHLSPRSTLVRDIVTAQKIVANRHRNLLHDAKIRLAALVNKKRAFLEQSLAALTDELKSAEARLKVAEIDNLLRVQRSYEEHKELGKVQASALADMAVLEERLRLSRSAVSPQTLHQLNHTRSVYQDRLSCILSIQNGLTAYRAWAFQHLVGPAVETEVNAILSLIDLPRPITLQSQWTEGRGSKEGFLSWHVSDGEVAPPYHKASGAQRFFTSLALRLACARIAAPHNLFPQLFLDEGFTSCDEMTMEAVPPFLHQVLHSWRGADVIYLVSHLESLKLAASKSVLISKGVGSSALQEGGPGRR